MWTGYYAKYKTYLEHDLIPCGISNSSPFPIIKIPYFIPDWNIVKNYKNKQIDEQEYTNLYLKQLNNSIPKFDLISSLINTLKCTKQDLNKIIFLCYEKSDSFCHRHILAKYLTDQYDLSCQEFIH